MKRSDPINHSSDWPERADLELLRVIAKLWLELASAEIRLHTNVQMMKEGLYDHNGTD